MFHLKSKWFLFRCPMDGCDKSLGTRLSLQVHINYHNKRFECDICKRTFAQFSKLSIHMTKHSNEKFTCHICSKMWVQHLNRINIFKSWQFTFVFLCLDFGKRRNSIHIFSITIDKVKSLYFFTTKISLSIKYLALGSLQISLRSRKNT